MQPTLIRSQFPNITNRDVLQLQHAVGNRAVGKLLAGTKQGQPATKVVQRTIDARKVEEWLFENRDFKITDLGTGASAKDYGHYQDTKLFMEVLQSELKDPIQMIKSLGKDNLNIWGPIKAVIAELNTGAAITKKDILEKIKANDDLSFLMMEDFEALLGEQKEKTPLEKFLSHLEERRGAYQWHGQVGPALQEWLRKANPLEEMLAPHSQINCWEAVLVAAAQANLIPIATLQQIYQKGDTDEIIKGVKELFLARNPGVIKISKKNLEDNENLEEDENLENNIEQGEVLMLKLGGAIMEHVIVVKKAAPENYRNIEVYSLWGTTSGNKLVTAKLGDLLDRIDEIRHLKLG